MLILKATFSLTGLYYNSKNLQNYTHHGLSSIPAGSDAIFKGFTTSDNRYMQVG